LCTPLWLWFMLAQTIDRKYMEAFEFGQIRLFVIQFSFSHWYFYCLFCWTLILGTTMCSCGNTCTVNVVVVRAYGEPFVTLENFFGCSPLPHIWKQEPKLSIRLGSITSHCSGNEPTLLPVSSWGRTKTGLERAAEIEPGIHLVTKIL